MFSRNFIALASLILSPLVFRVDAGSLISKVITGGRAGSFIPKIIASDKFEIQTIVPPRGRSTIVTSVQTSTAPWTPTAKSLIVNTTVPQGEPAQLGWVFESIGDGPVVFDGFKKNVSVFYTPPAGTEQFIFGLSFGPDTGLCGNINGFGIAAVLDSNDLGTYNARWIVEFGQSTQPYAPVDPNSGCGPEPFDSTTVEFERSWEVVEAE
ncbi:hypothetical protein C8J57DRAFT_1589762 [Mycena rebaudengoi]|nr:hypothetical protein C8J57DRAFT_1589762 [Mycena rebaudengoi]